jgi:outer membrane protein assembly factor BamB
MAAPTPAADGERVCALFATCDLACFDAGGTLLWYRALASDYAEVSNQVGMAASPILWRDLLILALETDSDAFVIALDRKTGRNRWKTPRGKGINWTTPLVARLGAVEDLLLQSRWGLSGYDPATGAERWKHPDPLDSIASPVAGGGSIFAPGGGIVALRPGKEAAAPEVLWKSNRLRAATASPLFYRGRVYAVNSAGVLTCAEPAAGEVEWQERLAGPFSASPVAGDGKIYCANEEGLVAVVDAGASPSGPEAPKRLLGAYPLGEPTLASPAIAAGALYFRTDRHLFCID